jgi:hypothetical protein
MVSPLLSNPPEKGTSKSTLFQEDASGFGLRFCRQPSEHCKLRLTQFLLRIAIRLVGKRK